MDVNEVGRVSNRCSTKHILHVSLDHAQTHFIKYQLPDRPMFGAGVVFCDTDI